MGETSFSRWRKEQSSLEKIFIQIQLHNIVAFPLQYGSLRNWNCICTVLEIYRDNFFSPRAIMEDSRARNPHCSARDKRRTARIPIESSWIRSPVFRATKEAGPRLWMERKIRSPGNAYAKLCRRARKSMPPHRYEIWDMVLSFDFPSPISREDFS